MKENMKRVVIPKVHKNFDCSSFDVLNIDEKESFLGEQAHSES